MSRGFVQSIFFTSIMITTTFMLYLMNLNEYVWQDAMHYAVDVEGLIDTDSKEFLINTKTCIIEKMDPFDASLKKFIQINKAMTCLSNLELSFVKGFNIFINKTAANLWNNFSHCEYIPFIKKSNSDHGAQELVKNKTLINNNITAVHPFVLVRCFNTSKNVVQSQAYAFFFRNKSRDAVVNKMYAKQSHKPMNVLIFGLESTSRMNFIRHMNETRAYINKNLGAIELLGYNKMGLNTFPNKVAAFLGIPEEEMKYDYKFLDKYSFIWKNFSAAGYRTFYIEDDTQIATFHYLKSGFKKPPVDHYLRTYMSQVRRKSYCSGNKSLIELMLDRVYEYVETYHDVPYYSDTFIGIPTHDNNNGLGIHDYPFVKLITKLHQNGYLNNTFLMFFGDHGSRYGSLRSTYQGRLEEQLPILSIVVPQWFKQEKADLFKNLQDNSRKLTSNFDIHATFLDIISLGKGNNYPDTLSKYGTSLFRPIRDNRTCAELFIGKSYCVCSNFYPVKNISLVINSGAKWSLDQINLMLQNATDKCVKMKLKKIIRASQSVVSFAIGNKQLVENYVITYEAAPSGAIFESAVQYNSQSKKYTSLGPTQRLNLYGSQSKCVSKVPGGSVLERYCYCKNKVM